MIFLLTKFCYNKAQVEIKDEHKWQLNGAANKSRLLHKCPRYCSTHACGTYNIKCKSFMFRWSLIFMNYDFVHIHFFSVRFLILLRLWGRVVGWCLCGFAILTAEATNAISFSRHFHHQFYFCSSLELYFIVLLFGVCHFSFCVFFFGGRNFSCAPLGTHLITFWFDWIDLFRFNCVIICSFSSLIWRGYCLWFFTTADLIKR